MDQDINILTSIIKENGVKASLKLFIKALDNYADQMSDLNLKEKATSAVNWSVKLNNILVLTR